MTHLTWAALLALALTVLSVPALALDSDGDGLGDVFEQRYASLDHLDPDTDGDGVVDSAEDLDHDKLGNLGEQRFGTDPERRDTDGDGRGDGIEDHDGDGRSNAREQDRRPIPAGLVPPLPEARRDRQPDTSRCQTRSPSSRVTTCVFGDRTSSTSLALVGDSNMAMYLTPFKRLAAARGWKLLIMTKAGCPAFLGMDGRGQYEVDRNRSCRRWRRAVIDRLNANPPAYLVYAHARYKLVDWRGRLLPAYRHPAMWRDAIKRTLKRLPARTEVLVMGLLPYTGFNPVACLKETPWDMSRCVPRQVPAAKRSVDAGIRAGATQASAAYGTLHDKVCSYDPCPVVQGRVLVWRDGAHITETLAARLTPSVETLVERKLLGRGA